MEFQPIPADDIIPDLNTDFENLSTMSSPAPSSFSSISASCNDGGDVNIDPEISSTTSIDCAEKVEPLPLLKSFVPIIEALPGLLLDEDNTYHVGSPLLCGDLKAFTSYARRVEDLVLTDVGREEYPRVSQDTLSRLALIQDPKNPFLSSLRRLQLVDVDSELLYLWLCITPSLETLEVGGIPHTRQISISNFFAELVGSVPRLANVTLGPGRLSAGVLQSSTRFVHLRHLRIIDAAASLNFEFLVAIAALPELELFDIDARTVKYTPHSPPVAVSTDAMAKENEGSPDIEDTTGEILEEAPFPRLKTLTVVSDVLLIHNLLHRLLPRGIEQVSLTLVRGGFLPIPAHWNLIPPSESSEPTADTEILVEGVVHIEHSADATALAPPLTHPLLGSSEQAVDDSLTYVVPYHTFDSWGEMITGNQKGEKEERQTTNEGAAAGTGTPRGAATPRGTTAATRGNTARRTAATRC
ncbi:hypothetical protein HYPSUDRAFT_70915 [Hypholoma sublateritium FD-334 SS-4]|uniref:Uncharacterized protein n=1 Tax=Hypholoma sublateritium (strain FD-334 SS-4) TaxID=945553 RepID=A0A0D2M236_HYPSF|nr:hypothetical protein HYPSUDRAFT_70915 [Hypholoma sublateritium FD-334 SS-4]